MDGWMDGKVVLGERERGRVREKAREKRKRERERKSELTVSTHAVDRKSPDLLAF